MALDRSGRADSPPGVLVPVPQDPRTVGLTYEPFYGLREKPFSLTSDARFFYQSRSHAPAFDDLLNAIRRRESLNVLTGDIGTGKTTLCRAVLGSLDRKTFSAFVPDPFASREDLLKILLIDFGVVSIDDVTSGRLREATRTELSYLLYEFLGTLAPLQAFAVVFIDEAQNLSIPLLEETRILSDADGQLQVVLVGQLEFREKLRLPEMRQLQQRVSVHCQLSPLDLAGVAGYIAHRLRQAGGSPDRVKFSGDAVEAIYERSGGVPRIINRLCDRALRHGYARRAAAIDREILEAANPFDAAEETTAPPAAVPVEPAAPFASAIAAPPPTSITPPPAAPIPAPPVAPIDAPVATSEVAASAPAPSHPPFQVVAAPPPDAPAQMDLPAEPQASETPEPRDMTLHEPLPPDDDRWLARIDNELEPLTRDWRQRWAPTNAVSPPAAAEDEQPARWRASRIVAAVAAGFILVFGVLMVGRSFDLWSAVRERFTPPAEPALPSHVLPPLPSPISPPVPPPIEEQR